ncbi:MAG: GNAT family N-acetyltransferase [Spirochaetes bacterium]|nr:GNAT family N-acetyltransferase [Spirochaetota bacterium]
MPVIINMREYAGGIDGAAGYYHGRWGGENNYAFFRDAIAHSSQGGGGLPRFYAMLRGERIIGCCGLVVNDFISRHDLCPWLAGLYVEPEERGAALGNRLMEHAAGEAASMGYSRLYLTTDHEGFYERYGWERIEDGYDPSGAPARIYVKRL